MIEELDHLEKRLRNMVARARTIKAESDALRQQVTVLTRERDALAEQLRAGESELGEIRQTVGQAESLVQQERQRAAQEMSRLQGTLDILSAEKNAMAQDLQSRSDEVRRLREVTTTAQTRINNVLDRLPGAPVQQEQS